MNGIDILIYVVLVAAAILGYSRGFVRQAGAIGAVVLAVVAARMFGPWATEHFFAGSVEPEGSSMTGYGANMAGYVIVFAVTWIAVWLVSRLLHGALKTICLGWLNSLAGAAFSVLEWALGLSLALNVWHLMSPSWEPATSTAAWVMELMPWLTGALSAS